MAESKRITSDKPEAERVGKEQGRSAPNVVEIDKTSGARTDDVAHSGHEPVVVNGEHVVVAHNNHEAEVVVLPLEQGSNLAQRIIAFVALMALCYFGKLVFVTLMFALLLAFIMEPFVETMQRIRIPRAVGALIMLAVIGGVLYAASYFSYVRAQSFVHELPKYTEKVKGRMLKFRQQAQQIQKTGQAITPPEEKAAVPVKQVMSSWEGLTTTASSITETLLAMSFIPFIAYFMVTWRDHMRASAVRMFKDENRTTAYVALGRVAKMLRAFITGNLLVGLVMGLMSVAVFWWAGVPYFYFLGFISGFLSLLPYLGVVLAVAPPLIAGMGVLDTSHMAAVAVAVLAIHLFAFNVLYPKLLGGRLQLNPLIVTISLLIWGFLWGAVGLLLAVPITAAIKIVCDHVESLRGLGELMGEGGSSQ